MAFLPIEEQNQQAPTGTTSAGNPPPQTGGSSGGGGAPAKTGSATGTPTQFGSSASKLGDYLTANAPQIQNQANQVVQGLNQQYGQVGQDITNAANQFGQSVAGGYAAPNQDLVNQALANPTQFVQNPGNVQAFQGQYNDVYSGPTSYESTTPYAGIQNEVSQAVQNAGLLNTTPGLQSYFAGKGGPNATKASNTLDALLLQGNPQAQQSIQNAAGQFGNLTNQFGQSVTSADQSVQAAQQAAQQAQQYAQGQAATATNQFNTGLTNAQQQAEAARQAYNTSLGQNQQGASTGLANLLNTTQADIAPAEAQWARELSTSPYWNQENASLLSNFAPKSAMYDAILNQQINNTPATLANTATLPQYQEAAALSQLLGQGYTSPLDQAQIGQAGTYKAPGQQLSLADAQANAQQQLAQMADLSTLYSNPASVAYYGQVSNPASVLNPQQEAQAILAANANPSSGFANAYKPNQTFLDALQRLAGNNYFPPTYNGPPVSVSPR
jgi:hypothetical protein